jgi:hypothetical protein
METSRRTETARRPLEATARKPPQPREVPAARKIETRKLQTRFPQESEFRPVKPRQRAPRAQAVADVTGKPLVDLPGARSMERERDSNEARTAIVQRLADTDGAREAFVIGEILGRPLSRKRF